MNKIDVLNKRITAITGVPPSKHLLLMLVSLMNQCFIQEMCMVGSCPHKIDIFTACHLDERGLQEEYLRMMNNVVDFFLSLFNC